jgi:hypothetical protein
MFFSSRSIQDNDHVNLKLPHLPLSPERQHIVSENDVEETVDCSKEKEEDGVSSTISVSGSNAVRRELCMPCV